MRSAQLLQLIESFEQSLLLALVGLELPPDLVEFKLPVDDHGLLKGVRVRNALWCDINMHWLLEVVLHGLLNLL